MQGAGDGRTEPVGRAGGSWVGVSRTSAGDHLLCSLSRISGFPRRGLFYPVAVSSVICCLRRWGSVSMFLPLK